MPRRCSLILGCVFLASALYADDQALWREYGLVRAATAHLGKLNVTTYQMKDLTGALAVWEWLRSATSRPCDLAEFCTRNADDIVLWDDNYVVTIGNGLPTKAIADSILNALPNKRDSALPAIFTFLPHQGLAPESARYILGPESLKAFAPELSSSDAGFKEGVEAQTAEYHVANGPTLLHLAVFYYPTPEMARLHSLGFKRLRNTRVKRSGVLVAVVFGAATDAQADTLLSRVEYEAKVTWNDTPPPSPIKPLYQLLLNIMYLSIILSALCLLAGLIYAGMRIYRRRYGTLEQEEAMTTLRLSGDSARR
jgi:Family of unknown function (DUF6599)